MPAAGVLAARFDVDHRRKKNPRHTAKPPVIARTPGWAAPRPAASWLQSNCSGVLCGPAMLSGWTRLSTKLTRTDQRGRQQQRAQIIRFRRLTKYSDGSPMAKLAHHRHHRVRQSAARDRWTPSARPHTTIGRQRASKLPALLHTQAFR